VLFKYFNFISQNPDGNIAYTVFGLNTPHDINRSSGAIEQPYEYDQLMAIWDRYNVINCRVTVKFINVGLMPVVVGYFPSLSGGTAVSQIETFPSYPRSRSIMLPPNGSLSSATFRDSFKMTDIIGFKGEDPLS
jgi:hypothetical protein